MVREDFSMLKMANKILFIYLSIIIGFIFISAKIRSVEAYENQDVLNKKLFKGYTKEISGENLTYHSPQPNATVSLLVRSLDRKNHIEWETETIPQDFSEDYAEFIFMAGIDANKVSQKFDLFINGQMLLTITNPANTLEKTITYAGIEGSELLFKATLIDKHEDLMGYWYLKIPEKFLSKGKPQVLRVAGESAGVRTWFMVFKNSLEEDIKLTSVQGILKEEESQTLELDVVYLEDKGTLSAEIAGEVVEKELNLGYNSFFIKVPLVKEETNITGVFRINNRASVEQEFLLKPVIYREIYLLHHSHVDIGYTHVQEEVEQLHWDYYEQAIELGKKTENYPEEARFKWNTETTWALESYLRTKPEGKRKNIIKAIQQGVIGVDGLYVNALTGICRPEELFQMFKPARDLFDMTGIKVDAAMITDIPGYTWGMVPAMVQSGIKYFSIGTNTFHRIGNVFEEWGDRPFYWVSPSGQEKVLCFLKGKGYSWFHTGLGFSRLENKLHEKMIFEYMGELAESNYPYDIVGVRYNIGSDNGPPDPGLPDAVREWNKRYASPKMKIVTTSELLKNFEQRYGDELPVVKGDFTGYWEDGSASTARESAINRESAERLVQAEKLWSMFKPGEYPYEQFDEAWRYVMQFSEHTWGSWNSISEPEAEFTKQQWETKKSYAKKAEELSKDLLNTSLQRNTDSIVSAIDIHNTNSWPRTDLIIIPNDINRAGNLVKDASGNPIPSQILSSGELAVYADNIPPLGSKRIYFGKGEPYSKGSVQITKNGLSNDQLAIKFDEKSGSIESIYSKKLAVELANQQDSGLNSYFYIAGRKPDDPKTNGTVKITSVESGPLLAAVRIESEAPGCNKLTREVTLISGIERIDIKNIIDKKNIYEPEGVHLAFPFNVPGGQIRIDAAWGNYRPGVDQIPGACKNYFSTQRWVDISNQEYGVTWATVDAPMIEIGEITADPIAYGWVENIEKTDKIYSYVMNNYWETNYKASQDGISEFRYSIKPHRLFEPGSAHKFGVERNQELIIAPVKEDQETYTTLFKIEPSNVIVTRIHSGKEKGNTIIRMFNAGGKPEDVELDWGSSKPEMVYMSSPFEETGKSLTGKLKIPAYGIITLKAINLKK